MPLIGDARSGDSPVYRQDLLAVRVRHGAVALDISDDAAGGVPNLEPPPVARIINVTDLLPMRVGDVVARRGRGRPDAIFLELEAPRIRRHGSGDQDHGQGQRQRCELTHARFYAGHDAREQVAC